MTEVTHAGTTPAVEAGAAPAADSTTADRVVATHLSDIRLAVDTLRHYVLDPDMLQIAALLDGAADREAEYLAGEPAPKSPLPGEEAWFAWAVARIFLGQEVPDVG
jgi:hypothetical protein